MGCFLSRKKVLPNPTNQSRTRNRTGGPRKTKNGRDLSCRKVNVNTIVEQRYTIFSSIGKGEFGHVVRAEHKHTKIPYAIKIIDLTNDIKELEKSQLELKILSKVKHKYVIQLHDVIKTPRRLYLVMDLATGGELMDRICLYGNFDEYDATRVLTMILDGLRYLHSLGITHRDLKPQNILYYHPGNDSKIVITDFGLSAMRDRASSPANYLMKTDCGTIEYMAPEVITRARYTNAVDMWSMGVIAYIVLSGRLPFPLNGNVLSTLRMICFCKYNFEGQGCAIATKIDQGYVYAYKVLECKVTYAHAVISLKFQGEHFFPEEKLVSILCPAGLGVFEECPTVHGVYYAITITLIGEWGFALVQRFERE